jgi:Protein of unknown function (DUF2726)
MQSMAFEQSDQLGLVLALIVVLVLAALGFSTSQGRRFPPPYRPMRLNQRQRPDLTDVGQQLHAVMAGSFEKRRVLSNSEYRVFAIIEAEIASLRAGYRVLAQTSLGQILTSSNRDAFRSINSKRVDILVVDRGGWPLLAIEYQGDGHHQGTAAARDAVKKEALRKAGVRYMECCASDTVDQIKFRLREHFTARTAAAK